MAEYCEQREIIERNYIESLKKLSNGFDWALLNMKGNWPVFMQVISMYFGGINKYLKNKEITLQSIESLKICLNDEIYFIDEQKNGYYELQTNKLQQIFNEHKLIEYELDQNTINQEQANAKKKSLLSKWRKFIEKQIHVQYIFLC